MTNTRAEKRRMQRDPLNYHKMTAASDTPNEWKKLYCHGIVLLSELSTIQMRISGLQFIPKKNREAHQEMLIQKWNETSDALQVVQDRLKEIEEQAKAPTPPSDDTTGAAAVPADTESSEQGAS